MAAGQVAVVVGGVPQDKHRLLPLHLRQLVDDVQQLLQVGLEDIQRNLLSSRPHFSGNV